MTWSLTLIPLAALILVILGVRVIQGKGRTHSRNTDLRRIEAWKKAHTMGPVAYCLRTSAPFILGYCVLGPATKYWLETGGLGYPTGEIGFYLLFAVISCAITGFFAWNILQAEAREATERLSRSASE